MIEAIIIGTRQFHFKDEDQEADIGKHLDSILLGVATTIYCRFLWYFYMKMCKDYMGSTLQYDLELQNSLQLGQNTDTR